MSLTPEIVYSIEEIKNDKLHGASELARQAVIILKTAATLSRTTGIDQFLAEQSEIGEKLIFAQPTMAPIYKMVSDMQKALKEKSEVADLESLKHFAIIRAEELITDSLTVFSK